MCDAQVYCSSCATYKYKSAMATAHTCKVCKTRKAASLATSSEVKRSAYNAKVKKRNANTAKAMNYILEQYSRGVFN